MSTTTATPTSITISTTSTHPTHDLFTVTFNTTDLIHTTVTADPTIASKWLEPLANTNQLLVGFDIEWRPNTGKQQNNPVATLQLCTKDPNPNPNPNPNPSFSCLIFQLLHCPPPLPPPLFDFLYRENLTFVGVGIRSDVESLLVDHGLKVKNSVDLSEFAVEKLSGTRRGMGLKELARVVLEVELEKPRSVSLSRWDCEWLSYQQIQYACVDAYVAYKIGEKLGVM